MERALNTKRPLSPHLQIYKPQLTSVLSISHRFTGVILSLFAFLIPFILAFISFGFEYYDLFLRFIDHIIIKIILAGTMFSLVYHLSNGIRHLFWDIGIGLGIRNSYMSGYLVVLISISVTFITLFL